MLFALPLLFPKHTFPQAKDSKAKDYEDFLDDLVEDFEVRAKINLFKDPEGLAQAAAAKADKEGTMDGAENADDEAPEVVVLQFNCCRCLLVFVTV